jgi:hypothetical protein
MFVPQPQVRWGDATIYSGSTLLFADMYTLGGGVALFPRPDLCHPLPAGSALRVTGRRKVRLDIPAQPGLNPGEFKVGLLERTLSQSAALRVRSRFRSDSTIKLVIDSDQSPDWSCRYGPVSMVSDIADLEELMQVVGHVSSSAKTAPELQKAQMEFGGPLAPVKEVIDFLTAFGLPFPFFVSLTNTEYGFKSGVKYTFPPPGPLGKAIDQAIEHGLGASIELELLTRFGRDSDLTDAPFTPPHRFPRDGEGWHSSFEASAKVLCTVARKVFGILDGKIGGVFKCEFSGKNSGDFKLTFFYGIAGEVELGIGDILSISGGRSFSIVVRESIGPKKGLLVGYASEWEVEGNLLFGLAAIKLSFELVLLLGRDALNDYTFEGEAILAFDVTLGWVFSKTYEVEFKLSETLAAVAFVATTVLPIK